MVFSELMFGNDNPFAQWKQANPYTLSSIGAGIASGRNFGEGLSLGAQNLARAIPMNMQAQQEQERQDVTKSIIGAKYPDLARLAEVDPAAAAQEYFRLEAAKNAPVNTSDNYKSVGGQIFNTATGDWIAPPNAGQPDIKDQFDLEDKAVKTYRAEPDVKSYQDVRNAYERVRESAKTDSGPGDLGLIFGYMKMLDPGSVVREGEFATAETAGGVGPQILNIYNKVVRGERLTPEMRAEFVRAAESLYAQTVGNIETTNKLYSDRFTRYGLDPASIIVAPETYEPYAAPQAAPAGGNSRTTSNGVNWSF